MPINTVKMSGDLTAQQGILVIFRTQFSVDTPATLAGGHIGGNAIVTSVRKTSSRLRRIQELPELTTMALEASIYPNGGGTSEVMPSSMCLLRRISAHLAPCSSRWQMEITRI